VTPPLEIRRARQAASELHARYWIHDAADIDVVEIAAMLGLSVRYGDLDSASARLVRDGVWGVIRVSEAVEHDGAQRFSVAHELGHHQLAHPSPPVAALCSSANACANRGSEAEANAFAAELLMPERLVRRRCEVSPVSLDLARSIAADFRVSVMAAAWRFVELTSERCALVVSRGRRVAWAVRSDSFRAFIPSGRVVDDASAAIDWLRGGRGYAGCQPVPADAWLDDDDAHRVEIWEDSVAIPGTTEVLTLLWLPDRAAAVLERDG
jgi:Zn-dependent peptidase ImmA (M78 family)